MLWNYQTCFHLVLVGGIQVVPGFWVVLLVPHPVNIEDG